MIFISIARPYLQKRIMAVLRKLKYCVNGVQPVIFRITVFLEIKFNILYFNDKFLCWQAWEETFRTWEISTRTLSTFSKSKTDDIQLETCHRSLAKRRASQQNSDHDVEVSLLTSWKTMTVLQ